MTLSQTQKYIRFLPSQGITPFTHSIVGTMSSCPAYMAFLEHLVCMHAIQCIGTCLTYTLHKIGKYPCLWCLVTLGDLISPTSGRIFPKRSLQSIIRDHQRFVESGGNLKKAQQYHNCIQEPFFNIELTEVKYNI